MQNNFKLRRTTYDLCLLSNVSFRTVSSNLERFFVFFYNFSGVWKSYRDTTHEEERDKQTAIGESKRKRWKEAYKQKAKYLDDGGARNIAMSVLCLFSKRHDFLDLHSASQFCVF